MAGRAPQDPVNNNDSSDESSSDSESIESGSDGSSVELKTLFDAHLRLITRNPALIAKDELNTSPLFTGPVNRSTQTSGHGESISGLSVMQYGLLGGSVDMLDDAGDSKADPRIFHNVTSPSSVFICGSQGSGKSHTLSCLLENCLIPSEAGVLPRPLTGVVFHYDTFSSDTGGTPCEAAYLSSSKQVHVRVLCPPTNIQTIKRIYGKLPNVSVEELLIDHSDLNTKRMLDLMAVGTGEMPLYLHVVKRVLRDMRVEQQHSGTPFIYADFKTRMMGESLTVAQSAPLQQRLDTLESFMPKGQTIGQASKKKKKTPTGTDWTAKARQLTIVDLSCPCVTPDMACSLFNICLSLFLEQDGGIGRVVALDEAHKYMTESPDSAALTNNLMETIRLQRHLGARVIISTQEPSISPKLLDLCSVTIVHRFSSPEWLRTLKEHLAGVSSASRLLQQAQSRQGGKLDVCTVRLDAADPMMDLFSIIVNLRVGEALVFAPGAVVGCVGGRESVSGRPGFIRLGNGIVKVQNVLDSQPWLMSSSCSAN
ncbi:hypothetical protein CONLIGDRAFT_695036 [Coniochaeta ligniaria NRRL 30616]|uniref:P-loop containing nucleoside triphosphate hydrolase protein n=1 Tax=Coniochaeta ligniaria NRRL 30616 TaxID=1408157 RepID=A0A1J7J0C6_9PEZI|nr:hypothetical protein CONLIGDRAFT_695036 [Coniochaeta ligniaria NRRL 30616]